MASLLLSFQIPPIVTLIIVTHPPFNTIHNVTRFFSFVAKKGKGTVLDIAPLNDAQQRFTTLEVAADWHWL